MNFEMRNVEQLVKIGLQEGWLKEVEVTTDLRQLRTTSNILIGVEIDSEIAYGNFIEIYDQDFDVTTVAIVNDREEVFFGEDFPNDRIRCGFVVLTKLF